jgi:hypothetical protein
MNVNKPPSSLNPQPKPQKPQQPQPQPQKPLQPQTKLQSNPQPKIDAQQPKEVVFGDIIEEEIFSDEDL